MARFDLTDVAREAALVDRLIWTERQLQRALAHRRHAFASGFAAALEMVPSDARAWRGEPNDDG